MKKRTKDNILTAFIGEAKAYFRLLAYAEKAEEEEDGELTAALTFSQARDAKGMSQLQITTTELSAYSPMLWAYFLQHLTCLVEQIEFEPADCSMTRQLFIEDRLDLGWLFFVSGHEIHTHECVIFI